MTARRTWALPFVPLYWAGVRLKDSLRAMGTLPTRSLDWPVISVGSLSAGGAGKTPVVLAVARLLDQCGWTVNVLSRGYGRDGHDEEQVFPESPNSARRFGDEPVMIASELPHGSTVWVGADRFATGRKAEAAQANPHVRPVHLLDDGFQHRQLARAVDLVLITAEDLDDALLPAGNRREPLSAVHRANIILLRENERALLEPRLSPWLGTGAILAAHERHLVFPDPADPLSAGTRPLAFCGIARPQDFTDTLHAAGCGVVKTIEFRDHFRYAPHDVEHLVTAARDCAATGFITTAKDWVKFTEPMRTRLSQAGPVAVVRIEARFLDPQAILNAVEARLG